MKSFQVLIYCYDTILTCIVVTASGQISLIEIVPFRYTPNIQDYVSPIGTEGLLVSSIAACARAFAKSDSDLNEYLSIFVRDELLLWYLNYVSLQQAPTNLSGNQEDTKHGPSIMGDFVENPFDKLVASGIDERAFFGRVQQNSELIIKRAQALSCIKEQEQLCDGGGTVFQTILDLISSATNPQKLAQMDAHWHPWF